MNYEDEIYSLRLALEKIELKSTEKVEDMYELLEVTDSIRIIAKQALSNA